MSLGSTGLGGAGLGNTGLGNLGLDGNGVFVYPAGRTVHLPLSANADNDLGSNAVNNGGIFVTDPQGERGTVWQGDGINDSISGILDNEGGDFWCSTVWFNAEDALGADIIWGSSDEEEDAFLNSPTNIRVNVRNGGTRLDADFTVPTVLVNTNNQLGMIIRQDGSDLKIRAFLNGTESTDGEQTILGKTIPKFDILGTFSTPTAFWKGEFSTVNVWGSSILLDATDMSDIHTAEVLP